MIMQACSVTTIPNAINGEANNARDAGDKGDYFSLKKNDAQSSSLMQKGLAHVNAQLKKQSQNRWVQQLTLH